MLTRIDIRLARLSPIALVALLLVAASPAAASSDPATSSDQIRRLVAGTAKKTPKSKQRIPKRIAKAIPRASKVAAALTMKALNTPFKPDKKRTKRKKAMRRDVVGAASFESMTIDGPTTREAGATIKSSAEVRRYADGSTEAELQLEISRGEDRVQLKPSLKDLDKSFPVIGCPAADGSIEFDYTQRTGTTLTVLKGNTVKSSKSIKQSATLHGTGHVGRDARFSSVDTVFVFKLEQYERGSQAVVTLTIPAGTSRDGSPSYGALTADASFRVAGASAKEERAVAESYAREIERGGLTGYEGVAERMIRDRMKQAEPKWYDLPNNCAHVSFSPESVAKLKQGDQAEVTGVVNASVGGQTTADFAITSVERGTFAAAKADSAPGDPARFHAVGAAPNSNGWTVAANVIATSPAGRAQRSWIAEASGQKVDITYAGSADYERLEGTPETVSQHHVQADYEWSVTYKDVDLDAGANFINFAGAGASTFSGNWSDDGRFGAAGPGSYHCGGPLSSTNPELAMLTAAQHGAGHRITARPFFNVIPQVPGASCTGLPSPPNATYNISGSDPTIVALADVTPGELANGPVTRSVSGDGLPDPCGNVVQHDTPCTQTLQWSGTVKIEPAD